MAVLPNHFRVRADPTKNHNAVWLRSMGLSSPRFIRRTTAQPRWNREKKTTGGVCARARARLRVRRRTYARAYAHTNARTHAHARTRKHAYTHTLAHTYNKHGSTSYSLCTLAPSAVLDSYVCHKEEGDLRSTASITICGEAFGRRCLGV